LIGHPNIEELKKLLDKFFELFPIFENTIIISIYTVLVNHLQIAGLSLGTYLVENSKCIEENKLLNAKIQKICKVYKLEE
jgi:hypothetical protein